jgi:glycine/D-amino acid oxidase-like deaminating enzyme
MEKAGIHPGCNGAAITQGAASLWPYKYTTWILQNMIDKGHVNLQTNTPVTHIDPMFMSESLEGVDLKARYKLLTTRGMVSARNVLLATNAYTSHLIPEFSDLIVPVRETMTALTPPASMTERLSYSYGLEGFSPTAAGGSGEYLIQRPSVAKSDSRSDLKFGQLMLGGGRTFGKTTMPSIGIADDSVIDPAVVSYLQSSLPNALSLGSTSNEKAPPLEAHSAWTGIWAASRDSNPFVGPVPLENYPLGLWICAAYTGHGMPNATLCAKAAVRMMLEANTLANSGFDVEVISEKLDRLKEEMISAGDLPKSYFLSKERIEKARKLPQVHTQDEMGILGQGIHT